MKKKLLSLALVLALCLSLAVPALAADPAPYDDGQLHITNVVENSGVPSTWSDGAWNVTLVCTAPAVVSISQESLNNPDPAYSYWLRVERFTGDDTDLHSTAVERIADGGQSVTLTEPGSYRVFFAEGISEDNGGGFTDLPYLVTVQAAADTNVPTVPTFGFTDVKSGDWFCEPVQWAVEKGITTGTTETTFSPTQDCTVAQILTFLWRANGEPMVEDPDAPSIQVGDVSISVGSTGPYYHWAALWGAEKGLISAESFDPTAPCTRAMAVEYIWKAAGSPKAAAADFADVPADAAYADAVAWAVEKGVTTGTSETTFDPDTVCNRGHIVTFLYRALAK